MHQVVDSTVHILHAPVSVRVCVRVCFISGYPRGINNELFPAKRIYGEKSILIAGLVLYFICAGNWPIKHLTRKKAKV